MMFFAEVPIQLFDDTVLKIREVYSWEDWRNCQRLYFRMDGRMLGIFNYTSRRCFLATTT